MRKGYGMRAVLALLLLLALLLTACGSGKPSDEPEEPETSEDPAEEAPAEPTPALPEGAVAVSTVDELLAAIAPNTTIVLREGEYVLNTAADYGQELRNGYYTWELLYGGCQLKISHVPGLQLLGQGQVSILTQPRYAEVLAFYDCWDLHLEGLTLGHTQAPDVCTAGVLHLQDCEDVTLDNCRLFGCGSLGIYASGCQAVAARNCRIDNCSDGAVSAYSSKDLRLEDCAIADCGLSQAGAGNDLFTVNRCKGFALVNCTITGNRVQHLLQNNWSDQVVLLGCKVEQNRFLSPMFLFQGRSVTVDQCAFTRRDSENYYSSGSSLFAHNPEGEDLISFDLDHMEWARAEYDGPAEAEVDPLERQELPDGTTEIHVTTVDQLLEAIGPDTTIILEEGVYELCAASDYGGTGNDWYFWDPVYDGWSLKLVGVQNLHIQGAGRDATTVLAEPRYAAVFSFQDCEGVSVSGLTAGHSPEAGYCAGNVLDFENCRNVTVSDCGLFGCGVIGVWAWGCDGLAVSGTEIYDCSSSAAMLYACTEVSFLNCSIYDCDAGQNTIYLDSGTLTWNDQTLSAGTHRFHYDEYLGSQDSAW